jgi:hypothetical protein
MALHSLLMLPVPIKAWLHALSMLVPTCQGRGLAAGASIITRCTLLMCPRPIGGRASGRCLGQLP